VLVHQHMGAAAVWSTWKLTASPPAARASAHARARSATQHRARNPHARSRWHQSPERFGRPISLAAQHWQPLVHQGLAADEHLLVAVTCND